MRSGSYIAASDPKSKAPEVDMRKDSSISSSDRRRLFTPCSFWESLLGVENRKGMVCCLLSRKLKASISGIATRLLIMLIHYSLHSFFDFSHAWKMQPRRRLDLQLIHCWGGRLPFSDRLDRVSISGLPEKGLMMDVIMPAIVSFGTCSHIRPILVCQVKKPE